MTVRSEWGDKRPPSSYIAYVVSVRTLVCKYLIYVHATYISVLYTEGSLIQRSNKLFIDTLSDGWREKRDWLSGVQVPCPLQNFLAHSALRWTMDSANGPTSVSISSRVWFTRLLKD